jgi:biofilm PGA synthesis N-glycosyltransferase PgaC
LAGLVKKHKRLRSVTLTRNYGKAMALRAGCLVASAEFLMCIDADALLARDALFWIMQHFLDGPRVGAVTGNPRVVNRGSLLARIQIGEFSAIIGMVKRTQRNLGRLFTVSGVNACYRRSALHDVGYWTPNTVTEDIDVSWKLQLKYWDIRYEPRALTWILVPESIRGLWRQRLRWAQGGMDAAIRYFKKVRHWSARRMWSVYLEYFVSVLWCYAFLFTVICWAGTNFTPPGFWPKALAVPTLIPGWTGVILAVTCLAQFSIGLIIDSFYERRGLLRYIFWAIWYPAIYWFINAITTVVAVPRGAYYYNRTRYAIWRSPNRRLRDLLLWVRPRSGEHRHLFIDHPIVVYARRVTELTVTVLFWGVWIYLVMPLLSLLLWLAGIYLFVDRMITLGGYRAFADQLANYGVAVLVMWMLLTLWVVWNVARYGRRERRNVRPRHVSDKQMAATMGLTAAAVARLRSHKTVALHFESENRPAIEAVN